MKYIFYIKRRPILASTMCFLIIVTVAFSIKIRTSTALPLLGFGGPILSIVACTCTESTLGLVIGTPTPGMYVYTPETTVYSWHNFFHPGTWELNVFTPFVPGPWVLGTYIPNVPPASACWVYVGYGCAQLGDKGVITDVGTSL